MNALRWAGALLLLACAQGRAADPPPARTAPPVMLDVVAVEARPLDLTVHLEGELTPYLAVDVFPRVQGFVTAVPVDRGTVVRQGQLLVRLEAPELRAQHAEAEAKVRGGRSTLVRLRAAAQTPGVVAGNDLEQAEAALQADRARARSLADLVRYLAVCAPFDGVITQRNVHPGALVGPPASANEVPMVRIEQLAHLRLTVAVPEGLTGGIDEGALATFTVQAWPARRFTGTIRRIAHAVQLRTRTMPVEMDVENTAGDLAPGMYADVAWPVRRATPSLFVPASAIVQTAARTFVVRVRDGVVDLPTVRRGLSAGERVEVFGALQPGDTIAVRGREDLAPGTRVTVRPVR